jgi:hypothetical protein
MALITYAQAVNHLRQNGVLGISPEDADLALKVKHATSIVLVYIGRPAEWDENADPESDPEFGIVQAAVLKVLGNLYRFRGDDEPTFATVGFDPLGPDIVSMLSLIRDPSMA